MTLDACLLHALEVPPLDLLFRPHLQALTTYRGVAVLTQTVWDFGIQKIRFRLKTHRAAEVRVQGLKDTLIILIVID